MDLHISKSGLSVAGEGMEEGSLERGRAKSNRGMGIARGGGSGGGRKWMDMRMFGRLG